MSKKILIPLIIVVVAALLAAAAYFVIIPRINADKSNNTADQNTIANTEQTSNQSEGKPAGSGQDALSANGVIELTDVVSDPNYMFFEDEQIFVENFVLGVFGKGEVDSYSVLSTDIPSIFSIDTNSISGIRSAGSFSSFYGLGVSTDVQINHCAMVKVITDQYDRHVATVTVQNGAVSEIYQMNLVVNLLNHTMVFFNMNKVSPAHSDIVENEYMDVASRAAAGDNNVNAVKAKLLLLYSYSPFIENEYWVAVSDSYRFSSTDANIRMDDIAYRLFIDWRPTYDGAALTVESIGEPSLLNSSGDTAYYECPIAYRTNHGGNTQETYTTATLHFYVNLDNMQITSLTEDSVSRTVLDPISASQSPTPSIKALLGTQ